MPENSCAKHNVSGINDRQARVGNDHKNSVLAGLVVIRMLVKMVSAELKRMIYFDVFLGNNFVVFNYL
jgi:hypothetical protein